MGLTADFADSTDYFGAESPQKMRNLNLRVVAQCSTPLALAAIVCGIFVICG